jgi:hypothetical protein
MPAAAGRPSGRNSRTGIWNIAIKRSIIKALPTDLRDWAEAIERALSQVRAWVEHPFHIVKNLFRHKRLRYRAPEIPQVRWFSWPAARERAYGGTPSHPPV